MVFGSGFSGEHFIFQNMPDMEKRISMREKIKSHKKDPKPQTAKLKKPFCAYMNVII